jgi:hypothetical protein
VKKTDWRKLARRFPQHTLVRDPAAYADVFAAIDEAAERARRVEPSPDEMEVMAVVRRDGDEEGPGEPLYMWRVPVVPVRCANTVRLCIGLLQYYRWPVVRTAEGGCLPHVDTLLRRSLRPTPDEAVDLASFLVVPTYRGREDYLGPSAPILKLIEDNFRPPIPEPLADVLREAKRRLTVVRDNYVSDTRRWRGRPQTKRFDKWFRRLDRLLGG